MAIRSHVQFEVASPSRSDSAPDLEKKMRSMAMEKLRMEKLIDKLYSVRYVLFELCVMLQGMFALYGRNYQML